MHGHYGTSRSTDSDRGNIITIIRLMRGIVEMPRPI